MRVAAAIGRWTAVALLTLFLIVWLPLGPVLWRAYGALPKTAGQLDIAGLDAPVDILRDQRGVPHIEAQTDHDAAFAMGFVHAQDRLWQMHVTRWYLRGEIAGVLGALGADSDAQMRTYDLGGAADAVTAALTPEELAPLQAYAEGVNAAMGASGFAPPLEFLLLAVAPQPWTAADVVLTYKGLGLDLIGGPAFRAVGRARLLNALGAERMAQFLPAYPEDGPVALSSDELAKDAAAPAFPAAPAPAADPESDPLSDPAGGPVEGSNNWVVSGERTFTGLPLLANDPHLSLRAPGVWYLASVRTPDNVVVGATVAGAPSIVLGRNDSIAWGFTNNGADLADLVFLPESAEIEERQVTIPVRFGEARTVTVRRTAEGPVLEAPLFGEGALAPAGQVAVLRWNLDDAEDRTVTTGAALNAARDWTGFLSALTRFYTPIQNMVFAGADGDIGFIAPGHVPVRDDNGDWTGAIPFEGLPRIHNPVDGAIVTANNRIVPHDYPYFLTDNWAEPYRAGRIEDLLERTTRHTPRSFTEIQQDTLDLSALVILFAVDAMAPETAPGQEALEMLRAWNGDMAAESAAALIYAAWMKEMARAVYADDLGAEFDNFAAARVPFMQSVLAGPNGQWCDDIATDAVETCVQIAGPALDRAAAMLRDRHGSNMRSWRWGDAHLAYFGHAPFGAIPVLDGIFSGRVPLGGNAVTVNVGSFPYRQDGFETTHAAGFRAVYDLADPDASLFAMPMGQSGHIASPHYRDLLEPWARGEYFTIPTDLTADSPGVRALTLSPE